ncbi:MAG: phosphoribosylanthranilate isomerase [Proteobacteria bacterium]|nr:phosphoribosylanthranilate isomerase [Pseudomonadota bacterium]
MTAVKICGLSTDESVAVAVDAGARYTGFVFFEKSPRNVSIAQARKLALSVPASVCKVALTVNATDAQLDAITADVPIDMLQLHGDETPARVIEVKARYGLPVMKVIGVADAGDLVAIDTYMRVSDQILVDAKAAKDAVLPGGNGISFDWRLIAGRRWACPWMLAGGLTSENVAEAVRLTGATQVDVSSGVESAPGVKDNAKIAAFIKAAQGE